MLAAELIRKKRDGAALAPAQIKEFISGYVQGDIADYQAAAMLMAIFFRGMNADETAALARAMMESGRIYHLKTDRPLVDKHSTGGVGDKISLVLAPLAAACGLAVPMVSGRGLGHTGGTLDKLESIPGFQVHLSPQQFEKQVRELGVAMIGQADDFVPADKKLYALRDVTGTVESVPLICSSILSKKAASGARAIAMDVKCGSGAFMASREQAEELARGLIATGRALGLPVSCLITNMDAPLGRTIGNAIEVREAVETLHGADTGTVRELSLQLVAEMLLLADATTAHADALAKAKANLDNGNALEIFRQITKAQNGDVGVIDEPAKLEIAPKAAEYTAAEEGYLEVADCREIGLAALALGAGRRKLSDKIDPSVGLQMEAKPGVKVAKGEPLVTIFAPASAQLDECLQHLDAAFRVTDSMPSPQPLIIEKLQ